MTDHFHHKLNWLMALFSFCWFFFLEGCSPDDQNRNENPYILVLGITQDGGFPQAGTKDEELWRPSRRKHVASLAIIDPGTSQRWLIDATPDFRDQLHFVDRAAPVPETPGLSGILLTHAHIGHYTGLIHLGREAMGAREVPVYAMPRMAQFLRTNAPWNLLVTLHNISIVHMKADSPMVLNERIIITPFLVPHRAEYTETVGFKIEGPNRSVLYLPDIDKWEKLDAQGVLIEELISRVDVAYLDGTFFSDGEIPGRDMREIPHPFISQSLRRFQSLPLKERQKIRFIHLNRTNPLLLGDGEVTKKVTRAGYTIARELERVPL